jgi:hypothetical protein
MPRYLLRILRIVNDVGSAHAPDGQTRQMPPLRLCLTNLQDYLPFPLGKIDFDAVSIQAFMLDLVLG